MKKSWTLTEAKDIFSLPFLDLVYRAQSVHREHFEPNTVQISTLLSIKTGSCPENCSYCAQSAHHKTGLKKEPMVDVNTVIEAAQKAKAAGSSRLCMGAAGRGPNDKDLSRVCDMIREVKKLDLEACVTLGMLDADQVKTLKAAGLDYYNHNIDTSESFYPNVVTTRTFQDRLQTLDLVRQEGIKVCCGGILGLGESNDDRIQMIVTLANFPTPPNSVPINRLVKIPGTPLSDQPEIDPFDFVRTIALARILMPSSHIRLSAGREQMSDELQSLCFLAGANSLFLGEKLLTTQNANPKRDHNLLSRLGLKTGH